MCLPAQIYMHLTSLIIRGLIQLVNKSFQSSILEQRDIKIKPMWANAASNFVHNSRCITAKGFRKWWTTTINSNRKWGGLTNPVITFMRGLGCRFEQYTTFRRWQFQGWSALLSKKREKIQNSDWSMLFPFQQWQHQKSYFWSCF